MLCIRLRPDPMRSAARVRCSGSFKRCKIVPLMVSVKAEYLCGLLFVPCNGAALFLLARSVEDFDRVTFRYSDGMGFIILPKSASLLSSIPLKVKPIREKTCQGFSGSGKKSILPQAGFCKASEVVSCNEMRKCTSCRPLAVIFPKSNFLPTRSRWIRSVFTAAVFQTGVFWGFLLGILGILDNKKRYRPCLQKQVGDTKE